MLSKLADLIEEHIDEFAALEALDVGMFDCFLVECFIVTSLPPGKVYANARYGDIAIVVASLRYYAGWADKIQGKTIEVTTIGWLLSN